MIAARLSPGAISESSSSRLPSTVAFVPTRAVKPRDDAAGDGVGHAHKDDRDRPRLPLEGNRRLGGACQDDVRLQADQLPRERSYPIVVSATPTNVHP